MSVFNSSFDNETNQTQSMTGSRKIHVSEIDFDTSCHCQVTACDGGTIKFCAPVNFKEGFIFDGDICDTDGDVFWRSSTALTGFNLEHFTSTCDNQVGRTKAVDYRADGYPAGTIALSTVFGNYRGPGAANLIINSVENQPVLNPATENFGAILEGGDLTRTKNVKIQATGTVGGSIKIEAGDDIDLQAQDDINVTIPSGLGQLTLKNASGYLNVETDFQVKIQSNRGFGPNPTVPATAYFTQYATGGMQLLMSGESIINVDNIATQRINGHRVNGPIPVNSKGTSNNSIGDYVFTETYFYYCYGNYNGTSNIWSRVAMQNGTW